MNEEGDSKMVTRKRAANTTLMVTTRTRMVTRETKKTGMVTRGTRGTGMVTRTKYHSNEKVKPDKDIKTKSKVLRMKSLEQVSKIKKSCTTVKKQIQHSNENPEREEKVETVNTKFPEQGVQIKGFKAKIKDNQKVSVETDSLDNSNNSEEKENTNDEGITDPENFDLTTDIIYGKIIEQIKTEIKDRPEEVENEIDVHGEIKENDETFGDIVEVKNEWNGTKKGFKCSICPKVLSSKNGLAFHLFRHTGLKPHKCTECDMRFAMKSYLSQHMLSHSDKLKKLPCEICGKHFPRKSALMAHIQTHAESKNFSCSLCAKLFKTKNSLDGHMYTHYDVKKFTCHICGKSYGCKNYLQQHIHNIHEEKRQFTCKLCDKVFRFKQSYDEHLLRHAGSKVIQCHLCSRKYYNKRELKKHMLFHTEVTEYRCKPCNMCFKLQKSLEYHNWKMHGKVYACQYCEMSFSNKKNLKTHLYKQHHCKNSKNKLPRKELANFKKVLCDLCGKVLSNKYRLYKHWMNKHKLSEGEMKEKEQKLKLAAAANMKVRAQSLKDKTTKVDETCVDDVDAENNAKLQDGGDNLEIARPAMMVNRATNVIHVYASNHSGDQKSEHILHASGSATDVDKNVAPASNTDLQKTSKQYFGNYKETAYQMSKPIIYYAGNADLPTHADKHKMNTDEQKSKDEHEMLIGTADCHTPKDHLTYASTRQQKDLEECMLYHENADLPSTYVEDNVIYRDSTSVLTTTGEHVVSSSFPEFHKEQIVYISDELLHREIDVVNKCKKNSSLKSVSNESVLHTISNGTELIQAHTNKINDLRQHRDTVLPEHNYDGSLFSDPESKKSPAKYSSKKLQYKQMNKGGDSAALNTGLNNPAELVVILKHDKEPSFIFPDDATYEVLASEPDSMSAYDNNLYSGVAGEVVVQPDSHEMDDQVITHHITDSRVAYSQATESQDLAVSHLTTDLVTSQSMYCHADESQAVKSRETGIQATDLEKEEQQWNCDTLKYKLISGSFAHEVVFRNKIDVETEKNSPISTQYDNITSATNTEQEEAMPKQGSSSENTHEILDSGFGKAKLSKNCIALPVEAILPKSDTYEEFTRFENALMIGISKLQNCSEYGDFLDRMMESLQFSRNKHKEKFNQIQDQK